MLFCGLFYARACVCKSKPPPPIRKQHRKRNPIWRGAEWCHPQLCAHEAPRDIRVRVCVRVSAWSNQHTSIMMLFLMPPLPSLYLARSLALSHVHKHTRTRTARRRILVSVSHNETGSHEWFMRRPKWQRRVERMKRTCALWHTLMWHRKKLNIVKSS